MLHIRSEFEQAPLKAPVMRPKVIVKRVEIPPERINIFNNTKVINSIHGTHKIRIKKPKLKFANVYFQ